MRRKLRSIAPHCATRRGIPLETILELGSGGGNNASHMKQHFKETVLVDQSPDMLAMSRILNPELEHHEGDMRTVRLGRQFDAVFVHDAVCYMTTETDLRQAIETAFVHCKPGGVALFCPDHIRENFEPAAEHGGEDADARGMRWLSWQWQRRSRRHHVLRGLRLSAARQRWFGARRAMTGTLKDSFRGTRGCDCSKDVGFTHTVLPFEHSDVEPGKHEVFVCIRPEALESVATHRPCAYASFRSMKHFR